MIAFKGLYAWLEPGLNWLAAQGMLGCLYILISRLESPFLCIFRCIKAFQDYKHYVLPLFSCDYFCMMWAALHIFLILCICG